MGRSILAVVVGVVVGALLVAGLEWVGHQVYPVPEDLDPTDREALAAFVEAAPLGALVAVLVGWALGSVGGGFTAAKIARRGPVVCALIVGGLLMVAGILNLVMFPHPAWFAVVGVLLFLPAAWLGARLAGAGGAAAAPAP